VYTAGEADFESVGEPFQSQHGHCLGAKIRTFAVRSIEATERGGHCDFVYFDIGETRVTRETVCGGILRSWY
jgi:hypothetical protein